MTVIHINKTVVYSSLQIAQVDTLFQKWKNNYIILRSWKPRTI